MAVDSTSEIVIPDGDSAGDLARCDSGRYNEVSAMSLATQTSVCVFSWLKAAMADETFYNGSLKLA